MEGAEEGRPNPTGEPMSYGAEHRAGAKMEELEPEATALEADPYMGLEGDDLEHGDTISGDSGSPLFRTEQQMLRLLLERGRSRSRSTRASRP